MSKALDRAFKISDGLAHLAGKKIKSAVTELQKEGVITAQEGKKIVGEMSKVKHKVYDTLSREMKKLLTSAVSKVGKKKSSKKKKRKV